METEAETGGTQPPVPRDTWSPQSWKRREGPSLEPVEGAGPWDPWTSDVQSQRKNFCHF